MSKLAKEIQAIINGDVATDEETRELYSHDASLFQLKPQMVVYPKNPDDVSAIVKYVNSNKASQPGLSITGRGSGTDMSGGAINDSIIIDFKKYFTKVELIDPLSLIHI